MTPSTSYALYGRRFDPAALQRAREDAGYTRTGLSRALYGKHVGGQRLKNYEQGRYQPSLQSLKEIAQMLKVNWEMLAPRVNEPKTEMRHTRYRGKVTGKYLREWDPKWRFDN